MTLDELVRDLTKVHPLPKSQVRRMILEYEEGLLNDYSNWLHKRGYIDSDYYTEEPRTVDSFLTRLHK